MDYHKNVVATFEEVVMEHLKDLSIQDKYGVKYRKWWANPSEGIMYCLMEGPSAKACEAVHQNSHGNTACSIIEVDPAFFNIFMGDSSKTRHDAVLNSDGSLDLGYRLIMLVALRSRVSYESESVLTIRKSISDLIAEHYGRLLNLPNEEMVSGVFNSADEIIACALEVKRRLNQSDRSYYFKIALSAGQPLTETDGFFTEALDLVHALKNIASDGEIISSSLVKVLNKKSNETTLIRFLEIIEEKLIVRLMTLIDINMADEDFTVKTLATSLGISRPQLYRKITALSGKSPNDLIRELRMEKARTLLKSKADNISQIALQVGYSNPSYFAKYFREIFGCSPSKFVNT